MKTIIFALLSIALFTGCATRERIVLPYYVDFSEYTKAGFYVSPDAYPGKFEPIGMIEVVVYPGTKKIDGFTKDEPITEDELLKMAVEKAKEKGADGLVDYSAIYAPFEYQVKKGSTVVIYKSRYVVRGLAIKRQ